LFSSILSSSLPLVSSSNELFSLSTILPASYYTKYCTF
jgi:hypothetical protein